METNNTMNANFELKYAPEIYERAKAAKEEAIKAFSNPGDNDLGNFENFSPLIDFVLALSPDARIAISLGNLHWTKGHWEFNAPPTRKVMERMTNLNKRSSATPESYYELHLRYDEAINSNSDSFYRHSMSHHIYAGAYNAEEEQHEAE